MQNRLGEHMLKMTCYQENNKSFLETSFSSSIYFPILSFSLFLLLFSQSFILFINQEVQMALCEVKSTNFSPHLIVRQMALGDKTNRDTALPLVPGETCLLNTLIEGQGQVLHQPSKAMAQFASKTMMPRPAWSHNRMLAESYEGVAELVAGKHNKASLLSLNGAQQRYVVCGTPRASGICQRPQKPSP